MAKVIDLSFNALFEQDRAKLKETREKQRRVQRWSNIIAANGAKVLRMKGMVTLPNRIPFMLMVSDDRKHQAKRDAWVKTKLEAIIKAGRADKTSPPKRRSYEYRIEPY